LLAYNHATFTPADLRNIARIGQVCGVCGECGKWEGVGLDGRRHTSTQPTREEERAVSFRGDGVNDGVEEKGERLDGCG